MAIKLPQVLSKDSVFNRYQILIQKALQPLLSSSLATATPVPLNSSSGGTTSTTYDIPLVAANNPNVIQLGSILSGPLQGWVVTRIKGQATLWDSQDTNPTPATTLLLNTSADVVVQLSVF
jgi:hypothetical protein